jgi:Ca2+-binding EF-hand superfamily protein
MLDLLWIKLDERFKGMAEAYRYFDVNFNNRVSFNEFQKGLDHLRIKYRVNEVDAIFKYLDRGQKGYISFGDFSELCEEKRR